MESRLVPAHGVALTTIDFAGVRGKGWRTWLGLPLRLVRACWQSFRLFWRVRPDVVLGLGGYVSLPAGLTAVCLRVPLLLHEQNAAAGLANRVLARLARRVFTAFPSVMADAQWVGNPLREAFLQQPEPAVRFANRHGPLRVLVVGGSLGAQVLNQVVPRALAQLPKAQRPQVRHQSGAAHIEALRATYAALDVSAELTPFIEDTASAFADADLVVCRAGASTVAELAAVGAAALLVPLPTAVDDHQTHNAQFLASQGAAWLVAQAQLSPAWLAQRLQTFTREGLLDCAQRAKRLQKTDATEQIVAACEDLCK
jgi:UDP-N-acetylglucosamine--N-acetylmuramyl-(pentapeptide) pyrophosphoryl-undecaprenol N-acetylglucosamine transferase